MDTSLTNETLRRLLKPVVRLFIRRSLPFQEYLKLSKEVYIEAAEEELNKSTAKVNTSRISAVTGLHRYDIKKVHHEKEFREAEPVSVLAQVVGQWTHNPAFITSKGKPRVLTFRGEDNEFRELVESVSKALNAGTILFELERSKMIEKTARGIRLIAEQVWTGPGLDRAFRLLALDMASLCEAVEENAECPKRVPNLHVRTEYDNIYVKDINKVRQWVANQGITFHKRLRAYLATFDKDLNSKQSRGQEQAGGKIVITAFSKMEIPKPEENE